jgi:hypothetical protein
MPDRPPPRYASATIQTINPGVEQYLSDRFWVTARWINIFDENGIHQAGGCLAGDFLATPRLRGSRARPTRRTRRKAS